MPLYEYKCEQCQQKLEVLRSFDDYKVPPSEDEERGLVHSAALTCEQLGHHWQRFISAGTTVMKAPGWGGKGSWIQLLALGAGFVPLLLSSFV